MKLSITLMLLLLSASLSRAETVTVQGAVSTWDGKLAAHAEVYLLAGLPYRNGVTVRNFITTNEQGGFSFNNVSVPTATTTPEAAGRFLQVVCYLDGYALGWARPDLKTSVPLMITLPRQGHLPGKVTDSAGKPLPGATVRITELARGPGRELYLPSELGQRWAKKTDAQGQYTFREANADQSPFVVVEAPGYNKAYTRIWMMGLESMPPFSLDRESHITGTVQTTRPGADLHRLQVHAEFVDITKRAWGGWQETVPVDTAGKFLIPNIPPGTLRLSFVYDPTSEWQPTGDQDITMVEGQSQNVVMKASPDEGTHVTGKVVDSTTGGPVANAWIYGNGGPVGEWPTLGRTGKDGRYSFYSRPGEFNLSISPGQPRYSLPWVNQIKHQISVGTVPLTVPAIRMKPGILLHIQVVDEDGKPVEGAAVVNLTYDDNWGLAENTDRKGMTQIYVAEPDRRVTLAAHLGSEVSGFVPYNTGAQEATVRLTLKKGITAQIRGVVVDQAGHPVPGALVMVDIYFFDATRSDIMLRTDGARRFQSGPLSPDYFYGIYVNKEGFKQGSAARWQAVPGQTHDFGSIALTPM